VRIVMRDLLKGTAKVDGGSEKLQTEREIASG
jgi:hypothetical protein